MAPRLAALGSCLYKTHALLRLILTAFLLLCMYAYHVQMHRYMWRCSYVATGMMVVRKATTAGVRRGWLPDNLNP